jgi:arsenite-transporting ATPase
VVEQGTKDYDLIVFDTAPSGHTARLMVLPEMMSAWTEGLIQRREKADKFAEIVRGMGRDSSVEDKVFGNDAADEDKSRESGIRSLLNRRKLRFTSLRDKISDENQTSFVIVLAAERLPVLETIELQQQLKKGKISVDCLVVNKRSPIGEGEFLEERRSQEEAHMKTLTKALPKIPRQDLYLLAQDIVGIDALQAMAERIAK